MTRRFCLHCGFGFRKGSDYKQVFSKNEVLLGRLHIGCVTNFLTSEFFGKDENQETTITVPPNSINTPPPDSMVMLLPAGIVNVNPEGITTRLLFWTEMFAGIVTLAESKHDSVTSMFPELGMIQGAAKNFWMRLLFCSAT